MPKLGDGMPYLGGYGLIATARVGRPSFPGILFAFLCESAIPTPVEQEQGIVYHKRTRQGCTLLNRHGGSSEERVHFHVLPFELGLADIAAREHRERDGSRA